MIAARNNAVTGLKAASAQPGNAQSMAQLGGGQSPPEFASTHPSPETRIQHLESLMPKALAFREKYCGTTARAS